MSNEDHNKLNNISDFNTLNNKNNVLKYYDVIIIGAGPAGCSASIYAIRSGLSVAMLCGNMPGGQLMITTDVENYPGFQSIMGPDLMINMMDQCKHLGVPLIYENVEKVIPIDNNASLIVNENDSLKQVEVESNQTEIASNQAKVESKQIEAESKQIEVELKENKVNFVIHTNAQENNIYHTKAIILATGASARWLGLESETRLRQNGGVSGCATCDGMFYKNKEVAVIGGGNSAAEEALFLSKIVSKVYIIHRRDKMRCEKILFDRILKNPKIHIMWNCVTEDMLASSETGKLNQLKLKNIISNEVIYLNVEGAFVAIGHNPNSSIVSNLVEIDKDGYIITVPGSTKTSYAGIFAAGDVQDKIFRQAVTAAGTGCMAALEVLKFLEEQ